jgi:hypothetical protein
MTTFTINKPVITTTPTVVVDAGLPPGEHRFQLVVIDSGKLRSKPNVAVVTVQHAAPPPPLIGTGHPVTSGGTIVAPGSVPS